MFDYKSNCYAKAPNKRNPTFLTAEQARNGKKAVWEELYIEGNVKSLSPDIFRYYTHLTALDVSNNQIKAIPREICLLKCLQTLDISGNQITKVPSEIGELYKLREFNVSNNPINTFPLELGRLYNLQRLVVANIRVPFDVYPQPSELTEQDLQDFLGSLLYDLPVPREPKMRGFIQKDAVDNKRLSAIFSVMSYNILADKLATRQMYGYCQDWALQWVRRRSRIMDEVKMANPEIVCLQEVETEQFDTFFKPEFEASGYQGLFNAKSRAKMLPNAERRSVDGCAVFWKSEHFQHVKDWLVEFNQLSMAMGSKSADMINRVQTKDNIGLAVLLQTREAVFSFGDVQKTLENQPLLIVNAHIHWDPEHCDVKLVQTLILMNELKTIAQAAIASSRPELIPPPTTGNKKNASAKPDANGLPMIFCGDLNSEPKSGVYQFLNEGAVPRTHPDFKHFAYHECFDHLSAASQATVTSSDRKHDDAEAKTSTEDTGNKADGDANESEKKEAKKDATKEVVTKPVVVSKALKAAVAEALTHPFRLAPAFTEKDLDYTNYTIDYKGVIDHIFFSRDYMRVTEILGNPEWDWFEETHTPGCPNTHFPSDHIPIMARFQMPVPYPEPPFEDHTSHGGGGGGGGGGHGGHFAMMHNTQGGARYNGNFFMQQQSRNRGGNHESTGSFQPSATGSFQPSAMRGRGFGQRK